MDILTHFLAIPLLFIFSLLYIFWRNNTTTSQPGAQPKRLPPEPAGARPIIGHLPMLMSSQVHLVRTLGGLADKYGPVFTIRIGMPRALVVSRWEAVKDCFGTYDKIFASRPASCAGTYLGYDNAALAFSTYDSYWRKVRKMVVVELLSSTKLEKLKHVWMSELTSNVKELYNHIVRNGGVNGVKVDMNEWMRHLNYNMISKIVVGRRYKFTIEHGIEDEEARHMRKAFKEFMSLAGELVSADALPFRIFRWLDFEGHIKNMKRVTRTMNAFLQVWIDEHVKKRKESTGDVEDRDFIDVMLSVIDDEFTAGYRYTRDTIIKATAVSMLQDGAETMAVNMIWLMSLLLKNREVLKRIQEELDAKVGRERWVEDYDIDNLVYLQAAVKESMRLYPPAPFLVPHKASEDCNVDGYYVPKGTQLFVNVWKLHRDPRIWPEPEKFSPERFLNTPENVDPAARQYGYIPFSYGRRSCPGISYGLKVTHLTYARLLQGFDFSPPENMAVDMSEALGITMPRANPLEAVITPRLPSALYAAS
nr:cytochrome P450 82C4-like [Ipomoea batatas]